MSRSREYHKNEHNKKAPPAYSKTTIRCPYPEEFPCFPDHFMPLSEDPPTAEELDMFANASNAYCDKNAGDSCVKVFGRVIGKTYAVKNVNHNYFCRNCKQIPLLEQVLNTF